MTFKRISRFEGIIIRDLFHSTNGLSLLTFWRRYRIPPDIIGMIARKLVEKGIVKVEAARIYITKEGRKWVVDSKFHIRTEGEKPWRQCPKEFIRPRIGINEYYIPIIKLLDHSFRT